MHIIPYLQFNGQCEEAFNFYAQVFHGKVDGLMMYSSAPIAEHTPIDWHGKVLHGKLVIGANVIFGADSQPKSYELPQGVSISVNLHSVAEAERIFAVLSEGGTVEMPLGETFWAIRFGMVTDRFGTPWMLNCETAAAK